MLRQPNRFNRLEYVPTYAKYNTWYSLPSNAAPRPVTFLRLSPSWPAMSDHLTRPQPDRKYRHTTTNSDRPYDTAGHVVPCRSKDFSTSDVGHISLVHDILLIYE